MTHGTDLHTTTLVDYIKGWQDVVVIDKKWVIYLERKLMLNTGKNNNSSTLNIDLVSLISFSISSISRKIIHLRVGFSLFPTRKKKRTNHHTGYRCVCRVSLSAFVGRTGRNTSPPQRDDDLGLFSIGHLSFWQDYLPWKKEKREAAAAKQKIERVLSISTWPASSLSSCLSIRVFSLNREWEKVWEKKKKTWRPRSNKETEKKNVCIETSL